VNVYMPIFNNTKNILIHIPKTGGTSFHMFLLRMETNVDPTLGFNRANKKNLFGRAENFNHTLQHCTYEQIKNIIEKRIIIPDVSEFISSTNIDDYNIYAIVRNPYDRMVSEYFWQKDKMKRFRGSFEDFVRQYLSGSNDYDNHRLPQWKMIEGCSKIKILRFENLDDDVNKYFGRGLDSTKYHVSENKKNIKDIMSMYN
jgi:hypothetical protein